MFWAEQLDPEGLAQGDIVDDIVFANVYPLQPVKKESIRGHSGWSLLSGWSEDQNGLGAVVAKARKGMGIVLTHGCDIDKRHSSSRVFVAPVQRLDRLDETEQQLVLEQARVALFPLPGTARGDLYADLRSASAIDPRMISLEKRWISMTEQGRKMLQARIVVLFTRLGLDE